MLNLSNTTRKFTVSHRWMQHTKPKYLLAFSSNDPDAALPSESKLMRLPTIWPVVFRFNFAWPMWANGFFERLRSCGYAVAFAVWPLIDELLVLVLPLLNAYAALPLLWRLFIASAKSPAVSGHVVSNNSAKSISPADFWCNFRGFSTTITVAALLVDSL